MCKEVTSTSPCSYHSYIIPFPCLATDYASNADGDAGGEDDGVDDMLTDTLVLLSNL